MNNRKIFYLTAALGLLVILVTFISLILDLSYWKIPPLIMLFAACLSVLGLGLTKSRLTIPLVSILIALGVSAVIHIISIIHGN